jgi:undecaprenol kinase
MDTADRAPRLPLKNRPFRQRLGFALAGLRSVLERERSFRSQILFGLAAGAVTLLLQPGLLWAALVAISIGFVLALEVLNAALEYALDHLHPHFAREIGVAKDAAAGAVLIASVTAFVVGTLMAAASLA